MTIQEFVSNYNKNKEKQDKCKYLVTLDIESTGLDFNEDQIIQLAMIKYDAETLKPVEGFNTLFKPEIKVNISLGAYLKHGLSLDDLKDSPKFSELVDEVVEFFGGNETGIVGYNIKGFDLPFLSKKIRQCGFKHIDFTNRFIYDVYEIEKYYNGMDQCSVFERYYNKTPEAMGMKRHDARDDIKMSLCIMNKQLETHVDTEWRADNICNNYNNIIDNNNFVEYKIIENTKFDNINNTKQLVFTKGKYYNCPVKLVNLYDKEYIKWVKRTQSQECIKEIDKVINN